jgi:hypothetical protein
MFVGAPSAEAASLLSPIRQALAGSDTVIPMDTAALPEGFEEIRREELARAFQQVLRVRYLVQPVLAAIVLYIVLKDTSWYRAMALVGAAVIALAVTLLEALRMPGTVFRVTGSAAGTTSPSSSSCLWRRSSPAARAAHSPSRCCPS